MYTNDKHDTELELISQTHDKQNKETLNKLYGELYQSLGVEPGLLSRSSIGRKIENKFKDDSSTISDNKQKYIEDPVPPTANPKLIKQSPLSGTKFLLDRSDVTTQPDPELENILNEYRDKHDLSSVELQRRIDNYCTKYFKFFI